jgi:hypothetical protein
MKKLLILGCIMLVCGVTASTRKAHDPELTNQVILPGALDSLTIASQKLEGSAKHLNTSLSNFKQ